MACKNTICIWYEGAALDAETFYAGTSAFWKPCKPTVGYMGISATSVDGRNRPLFPRQRQSDRIHGHRSFQNS
jgi:hypothetical protein